MVKLFKILTISFCILILLSQNIFALDTIFDTAKSWIDDGESNSSGTIKGDDMETGINAIFNILFPIAVVTAFIVGAVLGVQYMTAGIDKKVEVKESLYPYLISCTVAFGALGIWRLAISVLSTFD